MLQYMDDFVPKRLEIQGEVRLAARRQHQCLTSLTQLTLSISCLSAMTSSKSECYPRPVNSDVCPFSKTVIFVHQVELDTVTVTQTFMLRGVLVRFGARQICALW